MNMAQSFQRVMSGSGYDQCCIAIILHKCEVVRIAFLYIVSGRDVALEGMPFSSFCLNGTTESKQRVASRMLVWFMIER